MSVVSLELGKEHLHVDGDGEDELIKTYLMAAIEQASAFMNRKVYKDQNSIDSDGENAGDRPIIINDSIKAAILLTVGHFYNHREESNEGLTVGVQSLLMPFRINIGV